jgi:hypothetical protein
MCPVSQQFFWDVDVLYSLALFTYGLFKDFSIPHTMQSGSKVFCNLTVNILMSYVQYA